MTTQDWAFLLFGVGTVFAAIVAMYFIAKEERKDTK